MNNTKMLLIICYKKHICIYGSAGVGKSFLINKLKEQFKIITSARTGVAADNVNGSTIDLLLHLNQQENMLLYRSKGNEKLKTFDYIVIDEISMIDGHKFDQILDRINFVNKKRCKRVGEIKLIICGDPLQLPPVENDSGYFFNAGQFETFEKSSYTCVLREVK